MAAHLDLTHLRRHALPEHFMFSRSLPTNRPAAESSAPCAVDRPKLRAIWHVGACGRPICIWSIDTGDPNAA